MENSINDAIKRGFLQQVRFLIEYGHSVNELDDRKRTPLINCALIDDEKWGAGLARLLLEKGARISLRDRRGLNALHYACVYDRPAIVDIYLNALDFELTVADKFGNTALHYAANIGSVDICKLLIDVYKRYFLDVDIANKRHETPLIMAWKAGHLECGNLLVDECQADINRRDIDGVSANRWFEASLRRHNALTEVRRQRENAKRPRTASARLDRLATPKRATNNRPTSAMSAQLVAVGARQRAPLYAFREKESMSRDPVRLLRASQTTLYKPASVSDLRNKPEYVFQLSPAEYFVNHERCCYTSPSSSSSVAATSSVPASRSRSMSQLSGRGGGGAANRHPYAMTSSSTSDVINSASWREAIGSFFTTFDYQFSHSFCRGAVPPPAPSESEMASADDRAPSPTPTHVSEQGGGAGGDSEVSGNTNLRKVPRKVGNALSALKALSDNVTPDKGITRRSSRQEKGQTSSRKMASLKVPLRSN